MSKRWGRKRSQLSEAEKDAIVARWLTRERTDAIARDFGISPGQVSNIAITERGHEPHVKRNRKPEPEPAPVVERGVMAFTFNGVVVMRDGEVINLTDLWRAAGSPPNKRPVDWLRFQGSDFVEHVETVCGTHDLSSSSGRGGSTWGNKLVALAYATSLSQALLMHVLTVYEAYVEGRLQADGPETEALIDIAQEAAVEKSPDMMKLIANLPATVAAAVVAKIDELRGTKRRDLTIDTKRRHLETVAHFFGGMCPCCGAVRIVADGERLPGSHFDHWTDNAEKCGARDTWLICAGCNMGFSSGKLLRDNCRIWFDAFQKRARQLERQYKLELDNDTN